MQLYNKLLFLFISFVALPLFGQGEIHAPEKVKIGAYVISLHDINFHDKEYTMRFWLWTLHSNPDFNFSKQVEVSNAKSMESPDVQLDTIDGKVWTLMKMKATMKQSWQVGDFPFDKQNLYVKVENTVFDSSKLLFVADTAGSNYGPETTVDGWRITDFRVLTGITHYHTAFGDPTYKTQESDYGNFMIQISLERNAWGLYFKLFIGMYISFLISCVSFLIDPELVEPHIGLPVGGLFAAVGNKYIIDSLLPESSQFTLVDTLHTITFVFILITVAFFAISFILLQKESNEKAKRVNKTGGIIIVGTYVLLNMGMILITIFK